MQMPAGITTTADRPSNGYRSHSSRPFATAWLALPFMLVVATTGCKSGSSMGNSWWAFGMGGPDPATLAEAPPFEGDLTKPSATATPYPTTSTPESYALADGESPAAGPQPAATGTVAKTMQPPVTYGTTQQPTPMASAQPVMAPPGGGTAGIAATAPDTGVAPQVGPYQSIPAPATASPAATAATGPLAGLANRAETEPALPQPSSRFSSPSAPAGFAGEQPQSPPSGGRFSSVANQRVAEAPAAGYTGGRSRFSSPPTATAPVAPMLPQRENAGPAATQSRYGQASNSTFANDPRAEPPTAAAEDARDRSQPAAFPGTGRFSEPTFEPVDRQPQSLQLPAPPPSSRRNDPGYRPGGTSSYRAAEPIYAGHGPNNGPSVSGLNAPAGVAPASFEAQVRPAGMLPQATPAGLPVISGPPATSP